MPIELVLETYGQHWICSGHVTSAEIRSTNETAVKTTEEHNHWYQLIDFSDTETLNLDDLDIVDVSVDDASLSRRHPNLKIALVVKDPNIKDLVMKYLMVSWALNSNWEFRVYDSIEAARDWFNVQET